MYWNLAIRTIQQCVLTVITPTHIVEFDTNSRTSEKAQKPKVHSSSISSSSSNNMSCRRQDSDYSVVPSTPLVPPIVHSATYRVDSVEHFNQLISQVGRLRQGGYVFTCVCVSFCLFVC